MPRPKKRTEGERFLDANGRPVMWRNGKAVPLLPRLHPLDPADVVKRIVITGARSWENSDPIEKALQVLASHYGTHRLLIIVSDMPGVEVKAGNLAESMGIHVARINGLYRQFGQGAAATRGTLIGGLKPHLILAFHWNIHDSKYTRAVLLGAKKGGVKYKIVKVPMAKAMPSADAYRAAKEQKRQVVGLHKRDQARKRRKKKR